MDLLMHEYGWSLEQAQQTPVREALCLYAVIALRHGYEWAGPSYITRDLPDLREGRA
jgi:hypothetical protein